MSWCSPWPSRTPRNSGCSGGLLARIAPLHLIDPQDQDFTPEGCQSVHDVIRFIHEKAVEELMDLPRFVKRFKGVKIFTLVSDMPLGLKILDLGGGHRPRGPGEPG